jgi:hypothetical protein
MLQQDMIQIQEFAVSQEQLFAEIGRAHV